jgi:hypothetical protein
MPHRALRRAAIVAAAALLPGAAIAFASGAATAAKTPAQYSSGETYSLAFTPNVVKDSAGVTLNIASPQQPSTVTVTLPTGARLNANALPVCNAAPACEPNTQVGTGVATVSYTNSSGQNYVIPLNFAMYNRTGGLAVVITNPNGTPVVVLPTWSGTTLTIPYPSGQYKGLPIAVLKLAMTFNETGKGSAGYIHNPSTCPRGGWASQSTFVFASGVTAQVKASAKCALTAKKKKKKKKRH